VGDEVTCVINDQTGELGELCQRVAIEFSNCRRIDIAQALFDDRLIFRIRVWSNKHVCPLACEIRQTKDNLIDYLTNPELFDFFIAGLRDGMEYMEYIGPPYKVEMTETGFKSHYTPEQKRRMVEYGGAGVMK
jgi:hypothetical protein